MLYQITMSDGISYLVNEIDKDEFYKKKFYRVISGCIIIVEKNTDNIRLYDLSKNDHVGMPTILSNSIIRVQRVLVGSGMEALYNKTISKGVNNGLN